MSKGVNNIKKLIAIIASVTLFFGFVGIVSAKPLPKVNICHKDDNGFHLINVSENAKPAHLNHGDSLPGENVPGMEGKKFTDDCSIVDVVPQCFPGDWNLNTSPITVNVSYFGTWLYTATFARTGSVLTGNLTDLYVQPSGLTGSIINGSIIGNHVEFSFDYGPGSVQGLRTYKGDIQPSGDLVGSWSQTGSQSTDQEFAFTIANFAVTQISCEKTFLAESSLYYNGPTSSYPLYGTGSINFTWDPISGNVTGGYYTEYVPGYATTYYNLVTSGTVSGTNVSLVFDRTNPNVYHFTFGGTLVGHTLTGMMDGPYLFTATGI